MTKHKKGFKIGMRGDPAKGESRGIEKTKVYICWTGNVLDLIAGKVKSVEFYKSEELPAKEAPKEEKKATA